MNELNNDYDNHGRFFAKVKPTDNGYTVSIFDEHGNLIDETVYYSTVEAINMIINWTK